MICDRGECPRVIRNMDLPEVNSRALLQCLSRGFWGKIFLISENLSVKQILAQTKVTSKWKPIFQYIHVWNSNFLIPKATDDFLGHPCLMAQVSEWLSEPKSDPLLRMEGALVGGHWWSTIQQMSSQVNPRTKKAHGKMSHAVRRSSMVFDGPEEKED